MSEHGQPGKSLSYNSSVSSNVHSSANSTRSFLRSNQRCTSVLRHCVLRVGALATLARPISDTLSWPSSHSIIFARTYISNIRSYYKCRHVSWHYALCAALFTGGFVAREVGAFGYDNLSVYIVSQCLVYAAP